MLREQKNMLTDAGTKFNVMEYVRTTSIGCVQEPQVGFAKIGVGVSAQYFRQML